MNLTEIKPNILLFLILISQLVTFPASGNKKDNLSKVASDLGFTKILLVERHAIHSSHVYTYHEEDNKAGGGLHIYDVQSNTSTKILDCKEGLILDANLHYDGKTILFSWKKEMSAYHQLFTIDTDGKNLIQITTHPSNNFNACWLPDDGIAFLSDRKPAYAYCWQTTTPILFRCEGDGSKQTRLSANYLNDFTPSVMEDGRILYGRWEYVDRPAIPIQSLWSINPDGTKLAGVFGNRVLSPATFMDARMIPDSDGKILCVLTAHNRHCHGAIGIVDPKIGGNAQEAINNITPEINIGLVDKGDGNQIVGPYLNPFPLDDNYYLVSKDGSIELRDYNNTFAAKVKSASKRTKLGFYSPQPIREKKRERLISSRLPANSSSENEAELEWAEIQMMNVYHGLPDSVVKGSIKKLAIVQEVEKPLGINPNLRAFGFQFPVVSAGATYAPKKVWGFVDVEDDGSARFKVPARQPIYFLPLDENGMAVQRMRTFTHLMPGEVQGCIGCHTDRNYYGVPNTTRPIAMSKEAQQPEIPEWGVSGFSYTNEVQPIWDKHCVECHGREKPAKGLELTGDKTDFFNISYENLVRKGTPSEDFIIGGTKGVFDNKYTSWIPTYNGQEANILQIEPGEWGAKASLLAEKIESGHKNKKGNSRVDLTASEKLKVYMWLDLNVPYYGGSNSNYRANRGCRQQIPSGFTEAFAEMAEQKCISCHKQKDNLSVFSYPNQFALRIDYPEKNAIFMAPLDKKSGGSGKCKNTVFESTNDSDYQKLIGTFGQLAEDLKLRPRLDMFSGDEALMSCMPENRTYLIGDYSNGKVSLYSDVFGNVWSYSVPGVYDCWMRANGNVVAAGYNQVIEITPVLASGNGGKIVWTYKQGSAEGNTAEKSEVHSCQLLPNGNILVAEAGMPRLVEINPKGEVIKTVPLPETGMDLHLQLRMARTDQNGNYWIAYIGDGKIYCVNPQGKVLKELDAKMGEADNQELYDVIPLQNGNILASGAGTGKIKEFNSKGDVIWELEKNELPDIDLSWITGVQRLANGNTILCDWGKGKSEIKALEITPNKQIVWQLTNPAFKGISRIQVVETTHLQ